MAHCPLFTGGDILTGALHVLQLQQSSFTTSITVSSNKIQNRDILVPANPDPPGKWPLKWRESSCFSALVLFVRIDIIIIITTAAVINVSFSPAPRHCHHFFTVQHSNTTNFYRYRGKYRDNHGITMSLTVTTDPGVPTLTPWDHLRWLCVNLWQNTALTWGRWGCRRLADNIWLLAHANNK